MIRVLLADDQAMVREALAALLGPSDFAFTVEGDRIALMRITG